MNVQRGDVVIVEFPFASGMESKRRPCVVIQNDRNNARLHNVIVAQMTTRLHPSTEPTRLLIDLQTPDGQLSGISKTSMVSCENFVTVEKKLILQRTGVLPPNLVEALNKCLKASLALD